MNADKYLLDLHFEDFNNERYDDILRCHCGLTVPCQKIHKALRTLSKPIGSLVQRPSVTTTSLQDKPLVKTGDMCSLLRLVLLQLVQACSSRRRRVVLRRRWRPRESRKEDGRHLVCRLEKKHTTMVGMVAWSSCSTLKMSVRVRCASCWRRTLTLANNVHGHSAINGHRYVAEGIGGIIEAVR